MMKFFWSQTSKKHLSLFHTLNLLWKVTSQNVLIIILTVNKILEQCGDNCNQPKTSKNKLLTSITFIGLPFYRFTLTRTMFKKNHTCMSKFKKMLPSLQHNQQNNSQNSELTIILPRSKLF